MSAHQAATPFFHLFVAPRAALHAERAGENRSIARARALAASSSRFRGGALVSSEIKSFLEMAAT